MSVHALSEMDGRRILVTRRDWMQDPGASVNGGVWRLPLFNVLTPRPQEVAEAASNADPNSTQLTFDLGAQRKVGLIGFIGLRTTSMGLITIKAGLDPSFTVNEYEINTSTWPQDGFAGENDAWDRFTLNGCYASDEYEKLNYCRFFVPPARIDCQYGSVVFRDPTASAPMQLGCLCVWDTWESPDNLEFGWEMTINDESVIETVTQGSSYVDERGTRRQLNFGFPLLYLDEVWMRSFGLVLAHGQSKPLAVIPFSDPTQGWRLEKAAIYGTITRNALSNPLALRYAQTLEVKEWI